jgi:hypothetical protein
MLVLKTDAAGGFGPPRLAEGHPLRCHVLHRLARKDFPEPGSAGRA